MRLSRSRVIPDDLLDLLVVGSAILAEEVVGFSLSGRLGVGLVQQRLNAEKNLLDGDSGLPGLFLVEDREADGAGGVDVGMEERRNKLA